MRKSVEIKVIREEDVRPTAELIAALRQEFVEGADPWVGHKLAVALLRSGDPKAAIDVLVQVTDQLPNEWLPAWSLGSAYLADQRYPEAASAFRTALLTDDCPHIRLNLGIVLNNMGERREARQQWQHAARLVAAQIPWYMRWVPGGAYLSARWLLLRYRG